MKFNIFLVLSHTLSAEITYREVETQGSGKDLGEAVTNALVEAVGMVNGRSIESESSLKQAKKSASVNGKTDYFLSEDFKSAVKSATKGTVAEYSIEDKSTNELGIVTVYIRAKVAKLKLSASANRKRIAVFPLRMGSKTFRVEMRSEIRKEYPVYFHREYPRIWYNHASLQF